jgi:hypothetical protein
MKPKPYSLCLLLAVSAATILPVVSEDTAKSVVKTEAQLAQERQHACYVAIESQILSHINPEVSTADRFSRVMRPMPDEYYVASLTGENTEGVIGFQITHINRIIQKSGTNVAATGSYNSKTGELLLKNDHSGEFVPASQHPLLNKKTNT